MSFRCWELPCVLSLISHLQSFLADSFPAGFSRDHIMHFCHAKQLETAGTNEKNIPRADPSKRKGESVPNTQWGNQASFFPCLQKTNQSRWDYLFPTGWQLWQPLRLQSYWGDHPLPTCERLVDVTLFCICPWFTCQRPCTSCNRFTISFLAAVQQWAAADPRPRVSKHLSSLWWEGWWLLQ